MTISYVHINRVIENTYTDGAGRQVAVFFQGCSIHCKGCQNKALWPFQKGTLRQGDDLAREVAKKARTHDGVTITGGEPFYQPLALRDLIESLRAYGVTRIIVYTGYTFEDL